MKISLLENGLDSLKKGFERLYTYEEMYFLDKRGKERFFVLKDAILEIHHGIEILFKETLNRSNSILIFSEIDNKLKNAFVEKRQKKLDSLFEAEPNLHTVNFQEAIDRVQKICGHTINKSFSQKLNKLEKYRNQITHSEVSINEIKLNSLFDGLIDEVDIFFIKSIGDDYKTITGYSELKKNYKKYLLALHKNKRGIKEIAVEKFLESFGKCSISMGQNEVKTISDINIATNLLNTLYDSDLHFGTDLYNGHCSGDVSCIKRIAKNRFSIFTRDINTEYIFKFKKLLIFMPKVGSDFSPILFFEADDDSVDSSLEKFIKKDTYANDRKSISGIYLKDEDRFEWNGDVLYNLYEQEEYDEFFVMPRHHLAEHFLSSGVFCFINIQLLNYGNMRDILSNFGNNSLKEIEVAFRKSLQKNV